MPALDTRLQSEKAQLCFARLMPALALIALVLAQTLLRHNDTWHDFCIGFATGILIAYVITSFGISGIQWKTPKTRSDVETFSLTS